MSSTLGNMGTLDEANTLKRGLEDLSNGQTSDGENQQAAYVLKARLKYAHELDSMDKHTLPGQSATLRAAWGKRLEDLFEFHEEFSKNSNTANTVAKLESFLEYDLPYISKTIKDKLKEAATNLVDTVSLSNVPLEEVTETTLTNFLPQLTENEQKLLAAIPDKVVMDGVKRQMLESKRSELESKRLLARSELKSKRLLARSELKSKRLLDLLSSLSSLSKKAHRIEDNVRNIDDILRYVGGLSQEGRTVPTEEGTQGKGTYAEELAIEDNGSDMRNLVGDESLYADLLKGKKILQLEELFPAWNKFTGTESYRNLKSFCTDWNGFIQRSKIMVDASCTKKKVCSQKNRGGRQQQPKSDCLAYVDAKDHGNLVSKSLLSWNLKGQQHDWYFPGAFSHEKDGIQPVLSVFLREIAKCHLKSKRKASMSPPKVHVQEEVVIPARDPGRPKRIVDFTFSKEGRFQATMLDRNLQPNAEVKNELRRSQSARNQASESERQAMSHMAKFLYYYFNLFGVGVGTHATALTGTALHVTLHRLTLEMREHENEASPMARLSLQSIGPLPLVTIKSFDSVVESVDAASLSDLRSQLYGKEGKVGLDDCGIPLGMRLYWHMMSVPRESLFGPKAEVFGFSGIGPEMKDFGPQLGVGSFAMVVAEKKKGGRCILKVSTSPSQMHFKSEKEILELIKKETYKPDTLPTFVTSVRVKMQLGGVDCWRDAMILEPRGIPLMVYLDANPDNMIPVAEMVTRDVSDAFGFLYKLDICHNDVSPKNIVIASSCPGGSRAILVDFGIATQQGEKLQGVQGTPLYIHRSIFEKYLRSEWEPLAIYDQTALGFTVAAVLSRESPPWSVMPFPCNPSRKTVDLEVIMNRRLKKAEEIIEEHGSQSKLVKKWRELISLDSGTGKSSHDK